MVDAAPHAKFCNAYGRNKHRELFLLEVAEVAFGLPGQRVVWVEQPNEKAGFKEFILKPTPDPTGQITFAKGYYDSMYGRISSEWESVTGNLVTKKTNQPTTNNQSSSIIYKFTVPANSSATLYLPAKSINQIKESGKSITSWKNTATENDRVMIPLNAGVYVFEVK